MAAADTQTRLSVVDGAWNCLEGWVGELRKSRTENQIAAYKERQKARMLVARRVEDAISKEVGEHSVAMVKTAVRTVAFWNAPLCGQALAWHCI